MMRAPSCSDERLGRQRGCTGFCDGHEHGVAEFVAHAAAPSFASRGIDAFRLVGQRPEGSRSS